ncbi:hypothetical protein L6164_008731 [Bauhinia variegata]|uniref:Uncharacterized protein n=1 Tax=Bauhinia variegata TaxID=167791 RepID=A0ACB9PHI6_BAUVA|nr:hypothetical protein L6164_008731 [Bauhinia variegata]
MAASSIYALLQNCCYNSQTWALVDISKNAFPGNKNVVVPPRKVYMAAIQGRVSKLISSSRLLSLFIYSHNKDGSINGSTRATDDFSLTEAESGFSDSGNNGNGNREAYSIEQNPSKPIPGRPLRGDKSFDHSRPDVDPSDNSFLERFKLGFDEQSTNPSETPAGNQSEEDGSNPDQLITETGPQYVDEIFKKMKENGLIPNAVAMLDGLCKDGLVDEAMKLFGLIREKRTLPEIVVYTAVVEGYAKGYKADDAIRIFRKMQENGISPNAFSYTVLIQGLYKCQRLQDAADFCVEMVEAGHSPNVITFVGLVDSFCVEKGVAEAQGVIRTLIEKGFTVNEKAIREFLDKKAPFSSSVWEAIFRKKTAEAPF